MSDSDQYYRIRLEEELAAAEGADDPGIARIHDDLAGRYRALLAQKSELLEPAGGPLARTEALQA